jgi:hypothetical protein
MLISAMRRAVVRAINEVARQPLRAWIAPWSELQNRLAYNGMPTALAIDAAGS